MCELKTFRVLQQQNLGLRFGQLNTFKSLVALAVVCSNSLLIDSRIVYVGFMFGFILLPQPLRHDPRFSQCIYRYSQEK